MWTSVRFFYTRFRELLYRFADRTHKINASKESRTYFVLDIHRTTWYLKIRIITIHTTLKYVIFLICIFYFIVLGTFLYRVHDSLDMETIIKKKKKLIPPNYSYGFGASVLRRNTTMCNREADTVLAHKN